VIDQLLTSADAFKEFDTALSAYGLVRKEVFVDEAACGLQPKVGPRTAPVESFALSCGGLIFIELGHSTH